MKTFDLQGADIVILDSEGDIIKTVSDWHIKENLITIFEKIQDAVDTTFEIPEAESLMQDLLCSQIKANSSKKSDIDGVIIDRVSNREELLWFSVKSMVGGASTLLNAGQTTNFVYEVEELNVDVVDEINWIDGPSKIQDRLKMIITKGGNLKFTGMISPEFETNLRKIDTMFPIFLSQMLIDFFMGKFNKITDLTELLANNSILQDFRLSKEDYEYKIKNFLVSIALWMVPSKVWDGFTKAHGGYIVVKYDGEVVCYHLYNRDEFLAYLFENTKLESASSTRHNYGKLYVQDGKLYINLNLQIRFIK